MTEVRDLSSNAVVADGDIQPHHQYGLFATTSYAEGDVILTESPLVVSSEDVRSQFNAASLTPPPAAAAAAGKSKKGSNDETTSSIMSDLILPPNTLEKIKSSTTAAGKASLDSRVSKLRGMILAMSSYAAKQPSEEVKTKLFELYHPSSINNEGDNADATADVNATIKDALELTKLALSCGQKMAAKDSPLSSLLQNKADKELLMKLLLIYSCNAFEGGRIYHRLSRVNHSCNPNAVVVEGGESSDAGANDTSVLKAACDIQAGEEIRISYLGKYLYAGFPVRQRVLRDSKHFVCKCSRCSGSGGEEEEDHGDLASRVPCPVCHPRTGRYLDEDVMFDEDANDDENGISVCYAVPANGLTAEERSLRCKSCKGTTSIVSDGGGSMRKKKEGMAIKYMCMAEEKVLDRMESTGGSDNKQQKSGGGDDTETERDIDQQFLQMATSICGAQHWATHFLNLSLIEESLASFHSTLMTMGQDPAKDAETMEELFVEIAEAADGIERAHTFASSLKLNLDPSHWLFDYTVGLARTLVGLGDEKSQKYGAEWVSKVERYANHFENEGMRKVVDALKNAWKRGGGGDTKKKGEGSEDGNDSKRRKVS